MTSPIESANTTEDTAARTRPRIGRAPGSKNAEPQARAVRTRDAIIAVAAWHFDTDGYGHTSMNAIAHTGKFAKGAMYYHFPSKEGIGNQLLSDWKRTVDETVADETDSSSSTAAEQLTAIFTSLARQITEDINLRAGMKLTLEPSIDDVDGFAHWVEAINEIVDTAISTGEILDSSTTHRLAWNLCAGTVGAAHAAAFLGEDIDLVTRIGDTVAAHIKSVSA